MRGRGRQGQVFKVVRGRVFDELPGACKQVFGMVYHHCL